MTKEEEKLIRKKRLKLRMYYILIGLTVLMAAYLVFEIIFTVLALK